MKLFLLVYLVVGVGYAVICARDHVRTAMQKREMADLWMVVMFAIVLWPAALVGGLYGRLIDRLWENRKRRAIIYDPNNDEAHDG